jgi:hypothetical protein
MVRTASRTVGLRCLIGARGETLTMTCTNPDVRRAAPSALGRDSWKETRRLVPNAAIERGTGCSHAQCQQALNRGLLAAFALRFVAIPLATWVVRYPQPIALLAHLGGANAMKARALVRPCCWR